MITGQNFLFHLDATARTAWPTELVEFLDGEDFNSEARAISLEDSEALPLRQAICEWLDGNNTLAAQFVRYRSGLTEAQ
ncbi:MAG: hypothetical protein WDZ79_00370 [Candidatus Paceibacterota bacterium]